MNLADELRKLQELHETGALTDEEFARAKATLLDAEPQVQQPAGQASNLFPIDPYDSLTPQRLFPMQIIASSLLMGVVVCLGIMLYLVQVQQRGQGAVPPENLPIMSLLAGAMLAICGPLAFIVPGIITRSGLRQILAGTWPSGGGSAVPATGGAQLMGLRQTTLIVGLAMLEGTAFLGCLAYRQEAQPLALALVAVAVLVMLCKFPTEARVRAWLQRQADVLTDLRQQQDSTMEPN
jgi:hypothetical protein